MNARDMYHSTWVYAGYGGGLAGKKLGQVPKKVLVRLVYIKSSSSRTSSYADVSMSLKALAAPSLGLLEPCVCQLETLFV